MKSMKAHTLEFEKIIFLLFFLIQQTIHVSAQSIAGGYYHSVAKCTDASVMAWGSNNIWGGSPLGDNSNTDRPSPVQVHGPLDVGFLSSMIAVGAGGFHSLSLKNDYTVWTWGFNAYGQLGDNSQTDRMYPVQVSGLTNVTAVYGGDTHTLALKNDNTVWAWGDNGTNGKLGINSTTAGSKSTTPVQVKGPGGVGNLTNITAISSGGYHSIALKNDLTVWTWGNNSNGQLGDNTSGTPRPVPVQVVGAGGSGILANIISVAGGYWHSLALMNDGTVWAWGANFFGELGNGTTGGTSNFPVQVSGLTNIIAIEAGESFSLALKNDNTVWAWGDNSNGALGDNNSPTNSNVPVQVKGAGGAGFLTGIIALGAGGFHAMALKNDQTVWDWGMGGYGQLGDNAGTNSPYPVQAGSGGGNTLCNVTTLPVELISFSGSCSEKNNVTLHWQTSSEQNNNYFSVERSSDGKIFAEIGIVKGAGNSSSIRSYEFVDKELPSQYSIPNTQIYYRLKQTDYDGRYEYFPITSVRFPCQSEEIIVLPNPSAGIFSVTGLSVNTELCVYSIMGEKIVQQKSTGKISTINISDKADGIYFVNIKTAKEAYTQKIIIQK